jgi:hypothetical protein
MKDAIAWTLLRRSWHCLNILTGAICAIVIPLAYIICPELVVVTAGNPKVGVCPTGRTHNHDGFKAHKCPHL